MVEVQLSNISKNYGVVEVIHHLDLAVEEGEFVALVGPSGCGKSTLLRMISGLEPVTGGEIRFSGAVVNEMSPRQRNIAMVFQNYALYPHMTVEQNLSFNLRLAKFSRSEISQRVSEAARMLELTDLLRRRPPELSGGQRQRVAMGRALVRNPAVFLFDEPLSNLDAKLRVQMRAEIKALHQKLRTTSIYVTHDQIEAMTLADKVVVLNGGHIQQVGSPLELYRRPANIFVAGFIGTPSMNLIEATVAVSGSEKAHALLMNGTKIVLSPSIKCKQDQEIVLGIRPEHFKFAHEQSDVNGETVLVEPTGAQTLVTFDVVGKRLTATVDESVELAVGQPFSVSVDPELIHVFDPVSGRRLG